MRLTAPQLLSLEFPVATAAELVLAGECVGHCMVASSHVTDCECVCNGYYHGALAGAAVRGYEMRRHAWMRATFVDGTAEIVQIDDVADGSVEFGTKTGWIYTVRQPSLHR